MFKVLWEKNYFKDLDRIVGPDAAKIFKIIEQLAFNPRPPSSKKLKAKASLYRIRQGDYRIIYEIDFDRKEIRVVLIGHRKNVYRGI